jgi:hypothetical protein
MEKIENGSGPVCDSIGRTQNKNAKGKSGKE